jgi:hypothetical protein
MQTLSTEARVASLHAEHVLIVVKDTWAILPEVNALRDARHRAELLSHVVALCLNEYYGIDGK